MSSKLRGVEVHGEVLDETARAIHVRAQVPGTERTGDFWFPLSAVDEIHKADGIVVIQHWLARKEGFV